MDGREPGPRRTVSLRAYLLLLILGTMIPALVLAAFLARRVVADARQTVEGRLLETARAEAALVDAELSGSIRALQGLAQSDHLTTGEIDAFYAQAQRMLATQPTWSAVSLATPDGRQIANTERPLGPALPFWTDRETVQRTVANGRPAIGNLRAGSLTGELGFPIRVPVVRDGRVLSIVSAWITSRDFGRVLAQERASPDEWVRGVMDAAGVIVARSRDPERFVGRRGTAGYFDRAATANEGVYRDMSLDGTPVYGAFARAPISRWTAGVAVPASLVSAPVRESALALGALALLLLGLGSAGTYVISRRIAKDIRQSAVEAEALARGHGISRGSSTVTEIQRLFDALAQSAALLETRGRERDEQLARADAARAEAEAADRAKDEFLAMLGHELRNPLAPALTALELMKMKSSAPARERDVVERQIRHMARLVDDLLDVSRLRRGAIELRREPVDIGEAIARAVEMTAPLFTEKRHRLGVDVAPALIVDGDRIRLAQVFSNLLANAAKYTDPGGEVSIRARRDTPPESGRPSEIVVECRDSGIGIAPELAPHLFDLFVQGQRGLDRRDGGLGLGLAVARALVGLHGGEIAVDSSGPHRGSTFTVRLPAAAREMEPVAADQRPRAAYARTGRVLVVDDNADALDMLVEALQRAGVDAVRASTPSEALDAATRVRPRAAVLDIGLPEMNGYDLARALRSGSATPIRLVALTGYGRPQDIAAARAAGFDAFFVKPVDVAVLLAALEPDVMAE